MKIAIIVPPVFDYLIATIVEGLDNINVTYKSSSEYYNKNYSNSLLEFINFAEDADFIILTSNQGTPDWFDEAKKKSSAQLVYIDGSDQSLHFAPRNLPWKFIFKRELLRNDPTRFIPGVFPLPFGAMNHWIYPPIQKSIFLSYLVSRYNNPLRNLVYFELENYRRTDFLIGNTGENSNTGNLTIGKTDAYTQALRTSLCSVSAPGSGFDCARFWEILGAHTLLIGFEPPIDLPNPFIDGKHLLYFSNLKELREKIHFVTHSPIDKIIDIINEGKSHLVRYHTSIARAQYLIDKLNSGCRETTQIDMNLLNT